MAVTIPERRLAEIWQSSIGQRRDLVTARDGPVKIIYPGRRNDGRGADLKDAVIATERGLFKGDIEIHVKSSQWQAHGHHRDPAYNQVVLHVVYEDDAGEKVRLQNGLEIPTLPLAGFTEEQPNRRLTAVFTPDHPVPCVTGTDTAAVLEQAGEARFHIKAREYAEQLVSSPPGQTLYRGIMTALGYSKNKIPMARLAEAVPLLELEGILNTPESDVSVQLQIAARLLGSAGLLEAPKLSSPVHQDIAAIWRQSGKQPVMSFSDWEFFKVRPGNYPDRRLLAMAALLVNLRDTGLAAGLENFIRREDVQGLEDTLLVGGQGPGAPSWLGRERVEAIIINVALPFFAADTLGQDDPELKASAFNLFRQYPAGTENSVEKHMRQQLGLPSKNCATALYRQGLLHLYKEFCTQGKCPGCALNRGRA
jgi:hypothetical protein